MTEANSHQQHMILHPSPPTHDMVEGDSVVSCSGTISHRAYQLPGLGQVRKLTALDIFNELGTPLGRTLEGEFKPNIRQP